MWFRWLTFEGWRISGIKVFTRMLQYQSKAKSKAKQAYTLDAKPHDSHLPVLQVFKFNLCSTSTTPAHPIYGNQSIEVHSLGC
jgi:hypothetical protein